MMNSSVRIALSFFWGGGITYGMISPTSRVGLLILTNLIEIIPHRYAQKFIFKVVLDPVKLNNSVNSTSQCIPVTRRVGTACSSWPPS